LLNYYSCKQFCARQIKAVLYVKEKGKISNKEYQEICDVSKGTATKELTHIAAKTAKNQKYRLITLKVINN